MIALLLAAVLAAEPAADELPDDPVYRTYARRCAEFTREKKEMVAKARADAARILNEARRGIIVPDSSDGGDHIRSWSKRWVFESAKEKQEYVARVRENIKSLDGTIAKMRTSGRYLPAPLPIPTFTDDMGVIYDPVMVVSVIDHSNAVIRVGKVHLAFRGECRRMTADTEIELRDILQAIGVRKVTLPDGDRMDIMLVEAVDGIGLRAYLMEAMPHLK